VNRHTPEEFNGVAAPIEITGLTFAKVDDYKFDKSYLESLSK